MKFFIDTANLDQIKEAQEMGILDGVTTNPSLMAKEGITGEKNIIDHYLKICEIVDGDVSAEVISVDYDGIVKEGEALASLHKQIVIKVPMIEEGVKAIRYFSDKVCPLLECFAKFEITVIDDSDCPWVKSSISGNLKLSSSEWNNNFRNVRCRELCSLYHHSKCCVT